MKMLYILNTTKRVNSFSYTSYLATRELGIDFQIAGAWTGYDNANEIKEDEDKYGITIHQVDFVRNPFNLRNIKAYKQICAIIRDERIDIIHCNTPIGGVIGRLAGKKCEIQNVIYQAHGFHFYKGAPLINWILFYPIEKYLSRYSDAIITINNEDFLAAKKFKNKRLKNVFQVPGVGINTDYYSDVRMHKEQGVAFETKRDFILHYIKDGNSIVSNKPYIILSVGELNANKNNRVIIDAISKMRDRDVYYILCGDGNTKEKLRKRAKTLGIMSNVIFVGYQSDVKLFYEMADLFVLPSKREGLSRSLMEAMACGLPCIVSNIRGNSDLIANDKGGYLCEFNNSKAFCCAIEQVKNNKEKATRMSSYNMSRICDYSISKSAKAIKAIYESILNNHETGK